MTPQQFKKMIEGASKSVRLANAGNAQRLSDDLRAVEYGCEVQGQGGKFERKAPNLPGIDPEVLRAAANLGLQPSTDEAKLNKTEKAYLAWVRAQHPLYLGIQCLTVKLGDDTRYTPDFMIIDAGGLRLVDVKAVWKSGKVHVEDDARVKIHVAARFFPMWIWQYAFREGMIFRHTTINA